MSSLKGKTKAKWYVMVGVILYIYASTL